MDINVFLICDTVVEMLVNVTLYALTGAVSKHFVMTSSNLDRKINSPAHSAGIWNDTVTKDSTFEARRYAA